MTDQNPPTGPSWGVPSPATSDPSAPSPAAHGRPDPQYPPGTTPPGGGTGGQTPPPPTTPSPEPVPEAAGPRRGVLAVGAAGAAALLGLGGFLAGQALAQGGDRTTLTSADRTLPGQGHGQSLGPSQGPGQEQRRQAGPPAGGSGFGDGDQEGDGGDGGGPGDGRFQVDPARMTAGVITSVDSGRLVLRTRDGASVTVTVTDGTAVRGVAGTVGDLQVGQVVIVRGERQGDGSYTASELLAGPRHDGTGSGGDDGGVGGVPGADQNDDSARI